MKRFAIYTAIIGGYDFIQQPLIIDECFDYILFSDRIEAGYVGVWQVRHIDYQNEIQVKTARYVKTHPHTLLTGYDATLWIDASIQIKSTCVYQRVRDLYNQKTELACLVHPIRDCIYDELFTVLEYGYETEDIVLKWGHVLRKHHYPRHNGLCETGIMYRINNENMSLLNEKWWSCIEKYSRRDQLSFNYVLTELQIPFTSFLLDGVSVRDSEYFQIASHTNEAAKYDAIQTDSWLVKYFWKHPAAKEEIRKVYYHIYNTSQPVFWASFWGKIFMTKDTLFRFKRKIKSTL